MRHQCSEKGSRKYYGVTSSIMERNQDHRLGMAYSLDGECSDVPVGTRDSLDLLIMRRDRLTEHIERSYEYLCENLTSSGIGRGGARRCATLSPGSLMIGAQT